MSKLISDEYKKLLELQHQKDKTWGDSSTCYIGKIKELIHIYNIKEVLDYGCGKAALKRELDAVEYYGYDPGIPEYIAIPEPREFVICTDVLEHVELGLEDNVIVDLSRCTNRIGFFVISTRAAAIHLYDGRNAHLIQQPTRWWLPKFCNCFNIVEVKSSEFVFSIVVSKL